MGAAIRCAWRVAGQRTRLRGVRGGPRRSASTRRTGRAGRGMGAKLRRAAACAAGGRRLGTAFEPSLGRNANPSRWQRLGPARTWVESERGWRAVGCGRCGGTRPEPVGRRSGCWQRRWRGSARLGPAVGRRIRGGSWGHSLEPARITRTGGLGPEPTGGTRAIRCVWLGHATVRRTWGARWERGTRWRGVGQCYARCSGGASWLGYTGRAQWPELGCPAEWPRCFCRAQLGRGGEYARWFLSYVRLGPGCESRWWPRAGRTRLRHAWWIRRAADGPALWRRSG